MSIRNLEKPTHQKELEVMGHTEGRKHIRHDLHMSLSTKHSSVESLTVVTQAITIFEQLEKFHVQRTERHSQSRRPLSTRLVQGQVVDTFKDLEASASGGGTKFTEGTKSQSKSERFMNSDRWHKL